MKVVANLKMMGRQSRIGRNQEKLTKLKKQEAKQLGVRKENEDKAN
jgi:hypothetical protein